jgi:nicotinamide mononucleotide adenylyltransferase
MAMHSSNRQARNKSSTPQTKLKIAIFVEIQDISQNNVIKGAQQHVPYARKEVTWQKLVEVLGKQKNLKEKNHLQFRLIPIVS